MHSHLSYTTLFVIAYIKLYHFSVLLLHSINNISYCQHIFIINYKILWFTNITVSTYCVFCFFKRISYINWHLFVNVTPDVTLNNKTATLHSRKVAYLLSSFLNYLSNDFIVGSLIGLQTNPCKPLQTLVKSAFVAFILLVTLGRFLDFCVSKMRPFAKNTSFVF